MTNDFDYPKMAYYAPDNIKGNPVKEYLNRDISKKIEEKVSSLEVKKKLVNIVDPPYIITYRQYKEMIIDYSNTINWERSIRYIYKEKPHNFNEIESLKKQLLSKLLKAKKKDHLTIYSILINKNDFQLTNTLLYTILTI